MKRYILFLFLIVGVTVPLSGQEKITLTLENSPITEALREIERQSGYTFSYSPSLLKDIAAITIKVVDEPLEKVLKALFGKTRIQPIVQGKYIVLKKRPKKVTISGFIHDRESHETLISANIIDLVS